MSTPHSTPRSGGRFRFPDFSWLLSFITLLVISCSSLRGQALTYIISEPEVSTQVNLPVRYRIVTEGSWVPDHFAAGPLPAGLVLDPILGELNGTPTQIGDFQIRLEATSSTVPGDKATAILTLHVTIQPNPPWFSRRPEDAYTVRGGSATLQAEAQGSGPLHFQWFRVALNGANPETRTPIPGATESVLKLKAVADADTGFYQLQVSNDIGSSFSPWAWVYLVDPPQVTIRVGQTLMHAGGLIGIDSSLRSNQGPYSFQWRRNGAVLPDQTGASLVLYPVAAEDAGTYDVVVTNIAGSTPSNSIKITVADPVRLTLARHTNASSLIRFTAIPGVLYTIQSTADAPDDDATWVAEEEVAATSTAFSRLVVDKGSVRFYRIQAR